MSKPISLKIGNFLYQNLFPVYNILYPIFKKQQDADEINFLKNILKQGSVILDIGANIGFYAKILSEITGENGKVHSFEPDRINFNYLKKNLRGKSNVLLNNKAVSDAEGEIKVYKSKDLNVDHRTYPVDEYDEIEVIEAISIDKYVNNEFKVDFIKMDIQGYEISALKGMENTIKSNPHIILLLEFWPFGLHAAGHTVKEFCDLLISFGLKIYFLEKTILTPFEFGKIADYEKWEWGQYKNIVVKFY
ncbi:MAG: FkbM family methyltransferase [Bacteroidetes bacterium]|nr:FkbM family methyltransferase [Bacteroidota bacterium]